MLILIIGGAGSGKSLFAEQLTVRIASGALYYLATMQIIDDECQRRVCRHHQQRDGKGFQTIETPFSLSAHIPLFSESGTALLECLSNFTANLQFDSAIQDVPAYILQEIQQTAKQFKNLVIVSNDIFSDRVPDDIQTKTYLQNLGTINCRLAAICDIVIEVSNGLPICWKGESLYHEIMA